MTLTRLRGPATTAALATLAACSGSSSRVKSAAAPPTAASVAVGDTDAVFNLLLAGKEDEARRQLKTLLKRDPMSATARLLSDSIERDPVELLGPASYAYTVGAGDTPVGLAQRFLGNRLKAYQLIRYNKLAAPVMLAVGQVLRVPGERARTEPMRRPEPAPRPAKPVPAAPRPRLTPPRSAPAPIANPAAARTARAAGLAALNAGDVGRAVPLLRRAAALDPGNPSIARDLSRAERIAATVRARR